MITIMIVDDDPLVVNSLQTIVNTDSQFKVTGSEYSGEGAVMLYKTLKPDIVLMDIRMSGMTGLQTGKIILSEFPKARILYLTTFSDDDYIIEALKIGAKGYLLKQNFDTIVPALKSVYLGQRVYGDAIVDKLPDLVTSAHKASRKALFSEYGLSEKEFSILIHIADGLSNKEISDAVFLGEGTVRNYISSLLEKLQLRDRTQLAIFYYRNFR